MEEKKEPPTWGQLGCMWLVAIALFFGLWLAKKRSNPEADAKRDAEIAENKKMMDDLDAKLKHPLVVSCFEGGIEFGRQHKATGLSRLTDRELDGFALVFVGKMNVPDDLRGHAVSKFKSGYGWGYWGGQ